MEPSSRRASLGTLVETGDLLALKRLVLEGFNVLNECVGKDPVLYFAIREGQEEIATWLIENGPSDVDANLTLVGETPLMAASLRNNVRIAKLLLDKGAFIDATTHYGDTALMYACEKRSFDVTQLLVSRGASLDLQNKFGEPALLKALGDADMFRYLVEQGAAVDFIVQSESSGTALHVACASGLLSEAEILLEHGADVNLQNSEGFSPLISACSCCSENLEEIVRLLVAHNAKIDLHDKLGMTALMHACRSSPSVVGFLLERGASVEVQDESGRTALMLARACHVIQQLLEYGAHVDTQDKEGKTALMKLAELNPFEMSNQSPSLTFQQACNEHLEMARMLLDESPASVDLTSSTGSTALILAASSGSPRVVQLLLEYNAKINAQDETGSTALMVACQNSWKSTVQVLLEYGADVDMQDVYGSTALMIAVTKEEVEELLKHDAQVNLRDSKGETALMKACARCSLEVAKLLMEKGADIHVQSNNGWTALMFSSHFRDHHTVRDLLNQGVDVNCQSRSGDTALLLSRSADVTALLLENGASVDVQNESGQTALMNACREGNLGMVNALLEAGSSVNLQDSSGWTSIMHLTFRANVSASMALSLIARFSAGGSLSSEIMDLHVQQFVPVAHLLLQKDADLELLGNEGLDAFEIASRVGNYLFADLFGFVMHNEVSRVLQFELGLSRSVVLHFFDLKLVTLEDCKSLKESDLETFVPDERTKVLEWSSKLGREKRASLAKRISRSLVSSFTKKT